MSFYLMLADGAETAWLNLTNGLLGIAVVLCFGLIVGAAVREIGRHGDERQGRRSASR